LSEDTDGSELKDLIKGYDTNIVNKIIDIITKQNNKEEEVQDSNEVNNQNEGLSQAENENINQREENPNININSDRN